MIKIILFVGLSSLLVACAGIENSLFDMGLSLERSMSDLERKEITIDGKRWVYLEANANQDKPIVLLLHGFGAEKDNWIRMARSLGDYHIIAPDLPAHGESFYDSNKYYGFDQQSLRLAEFVNALGFKRFHIVGNSMGGGIAGIYAYRNPNKVISLGLIDAVGFYGHEASDVEQILETGNDNPLIVKDREGFDTLIEFAMHQPPFMPWPAANVLARRAIARQKKNEQVFEHIFKEAQTAKMSGGFTHIFEKIEMPTYVVWGDQDRVLHVSSVEEFFLHMPNVRVDVLPQVGHAPMLEAPEITAKMFDQFWKDVAFSTVPVN
ncbi:MAG: pimeloyl-ACP methyl ester carboxylesterase [Bermanella sp.]|jgi:pimeloyl-ACP methyl ester carboxylesterase